MKTQHVVKLVKQADNTVAIFDKSKKFFQVSEFDYILELALNGKKEAYYYAFINTKGELRLELEVNPKEYWRLNL